jgi:hypothetical protein
MGSSAKGTTLDDYRVMEKIVIEVGDLVQRTMDDQAQVGY